MPSFLKRLARTVVKDYSHRDALRALRGAFVFMVPFLVGLALGSPQDAVFAAFSAHSIALVDVEGPYVLRLNLLCVLSVAFTISAALGTLASGSMAGAVVATGLLGVSVGAWRQLCRDYGPMAAVPCALILFTALGLSPLGTPLAELGPAAARHALATLAGGLFGVACLLGYWPLRPQYPLRRLVARNWSGLSGLAQAVGLVWEGEDPTAARKAAGQSDRLRATLDAAFAQLSPLQEPGGHLFWNNLAALNLAAARLSSRLTALRALLDGHPELPDAGMVEALARLAKACRVVAYVVVRPRPGSVQTAVEAIAWARHGLSRVAERLHCAPGNCDTTRRLAALLRAADDQWPEVERALRQVSRPHVGRAAFRAELRRWPHWGLRPLRGAFSWRQSLDPALLRYTLGLTGLLMAAAAAFKGVGLAHGSWLPFSMMVVLQPNARLTRSRMSHRVIGTVAGAALAGLPFWADVPMPWLLAVIGASCAIFTYLMRRHYGTAVFFITVTVVLMTGLGQALPGALALERLGCVIVGSLAAWLAAKTLWPGLSAAQLQGILDAALETNRAYLIVLRSALAAGGRRLHEASVEAKRRAERANKRLSAALAEFRLQPVAATDANAALVARAAVSPRVTGMLTVLFLQQEATPEPFDDTDVVALGRIALAALDRLMGLDPKEEGPLLVGLSTPAENSTGRPGDSIDPERQGRRQNVLCQLRDISAVLSRVGHDADAPASCPGDANHPPFGRLDAAKP
ncbi:MAG: FUSC family protein [Solidesulfovibrio sp.]